MRRQLVADAVQEDHMDVEVNDEVDPVLVRQRARREWLSTCEMIAILMFMSV
jgi:hypothetical protein